jgi:galactitol-specific phosphotransferase system IIB component
LFVVSLLLACSDKTITSELAKSTVKEVLKEDKVTKKIKIEEIDSTFSKGQDIRSFQNGRVTVLSVGTEIYSVGENKDILIAEVKW